MRKRRLVHSSTLAQVGLPSLIILLVGVSLSACRKPAPEIATDAPLSIESSHGPIKITMTAEPGTVQLDHDTLLRIIIIAPSEMDVRLPELIDRAQGFNISGKYERDPQTEAGRTRREIHMRLTPVIAEVYRIAPLAITYIDNSSSPPTEAWFATSPLRLNLKMRAADEGASVSGDVSPTWVRPETKTILLYIAGGILALGLLFLLVKLITRVKEEVVLRRMSPKERALRELAELMRRDLIKRNLIKEFYFELTMIVRRYIERQHGVRAPEQTTEEFLQAISANPRFSDETITRLKAFLQAADLVKYAGFEPDPTSVSQATQTATDYIEHDAAAAEPPGGTE